MKLNLRQLRKRMEGMPFHELVGLRIAKVHPDGVTVEVPMRQELRNGAGVLHGGVSATLVDVAVGFAIARHFGGKREFTTTELKINYFRPIAQGKVAARSKLLRVGKHLVIASVELADGDGKSTGFATVTYMLL
ncbi:MAG TPA: PaaI family thioesterase [Bryobacteraceae bacterium]|nr:PaaI family thioesterase [Bryobacteraceae bacterium]